MYVKETKLYSLVSSPEENDNIETIISLVEDFKEQIDMMNSDLDYGLDEVLGNLDNALNSLNNIFEHMEVRTSNEDDDDDDDDDDDANIDVIEIEYGA